MLDAIWFFLGLHLLILTLYSACAVKLAHVSARKAVVIVVCWQVLYSAVIVSLDSSLLDWQNPVLVYLGLTTAVVFLAMLITDCWRQRSDDQWMYGEETAVSASQLTNPFVIARELQMKIRRVKAVK